MGGASLELTDSSGHSRLARCIKDPSSASLGILETVLCGTTTGADVNQANVSAANTARTTATKVLCVQVLDASGAVMGTTVSIADVTGVDGAAAPSKTMQAGGKDGAGNLQTFLAGTAGQLIIDLYSGLPGESVSDDWVKFCLQSHYKIPVAPTGPTTVTSLTTCLPFIDCTTFGPFWVFVYSNGAALTACNVEVSPDGTTGTPYPLTVKDADEIACQTLGSGLQGVAYKFTRGLQGSLRIQCNCATSTAVTVALVAQA